MAKKPTRAQKVAAVAKRGATAGERNAAKAAQGRMRGVTTAKRAGGTRAGGRMRPIPRNRSLVVAASRAVAGASRST